MSDILQFIAAIPIALYLLYWIDKKFTPDMDKARKDGALRIGYDDDDPNSVYNSEIEEN